MKSSGTGYLLWLLGLLGICGAHRFYAGKVGTGLIWLFTLGLLGVGQLIDLFLVPGMVQDANVKQAILAGGSLNGPRQNVIVNIVAPRPDQIGMEASPRLLPPA